MHIMGTLVFIICLAGYAFETCPKDEFPVGKECCPLCRPGWHFVKNCSEKEERNTKCSRCPDGTFQAVNNKEQQCSTCTKCDAGLGLKVEKSCSSKSDAVCEVLDGFFCSDSNRGGCGTAQRHRLSCSPGQYIGQRGTADKDTECLHCADGTFSNGTSSCQNHTKCESVGLKLIIPGTESTDSECGEHGPHPGLVAGIVIPVVILGMALMALMIIAIIYRKNKREKANQRRDEKRETQEQETETTPLKSTLGVDGPEPIRDQQEHTITIPDGTMDDQDDDQSLAPAPPSSPTHNGSVSVSVHQEGDPIVSPSSDKCTITANGASVHFKREIGAS